MRRSRLVAAAIGVVALLAALSVTATGSMFGPDQRGEPPQPSYIPDPNFVRLPELTSNQEERVKAIALADPRVQALLADHPYNIAQVGEWTGERGSLIGGIVDFSLGGPTDIVGEWFVFSAPECAFDPLSTPVTVSYRAMYSGVDEVHVLVDLGVEQVAEIAPFSWEDGQLVGEREYTGEYKEIVGCSQD
jgi:hypothetical protein